MVAAATIVRECVDWLRSHYKEFQFFAERDIVWTLQIQLAELVHKSNAALCVRTEYPIFSGARRSVCTDLALVSLTGDIEFALEIKYEPDHSRLDIPKQTSRGAMG
jgi:hypothetical protein